MRTADNGGCSPGLIIPSFPSKQTRRGGGETHLGFAYAALLAEPDYHPLPRTDVARTQGGSVVS